MEGIIYVTFKTECSKTPTWRKELFCKPGSFTISLQEVLTLAFEDFVRASLALSEYPVCFPQSA